MEELNTTEEKVTDVVRLQELWLAFVARKYWFLLSVVLCLSVAILYLLRTPPVYTQTATVLLKDESKKGNSISSIDGAFDFGMFQSNANINNELFIIKSPTIVEHVVALLSLDETFVVSKGLRKINLYKISPVSIALTDAGADAVFDFDITLNNDKQYTLSNFRIMDQDMGGSISGVYGDSVQTPIGFVTLNKTVFYNDEEYKDRVIHFSKMNRQLVAEQYVNALTAVIADKQSTIINLSINDPSVQKAKDFLNTLIDVYNKSWMEDKNQLASNTSEFIGERLDNIESELNKVDEDLSQFKSKHKLPDIQAAATMSLNQSATSQQELMKLSNQLSAANFVLNYLSNNSKEEMLPASAGIGVDIESQIGAYNQLLQKRDRLVGGSGGSTNPMVIEANKALLSMRQALIESVQNLIVSLKMQIQSMEKWEAQSSQRIASSPDQARYIESVERKKKVTEGLYLYLLQKREENELTKSYSNSNLRVVTPPIGAFTPTAPNTKVIILAALMLALLIPAVIIYIIEVLDNHVRGTKELEKLAVPFLGWIPHLESKHKSFFKVFFKKKDEHLGIVVKAGNRDSVNESFRVVRTNLDFVLSNTHQKKGKVLMTTSLLPNSGKTFITLNMAVTMALKDKRVLQIDLDLRKAAASTHVGAPSTGVANYLAGQVKSWESIVVKGQLHEHVDVLPVGTIPPNPAELLLNPALTKMLEEVRSHYDYIFIDCPPIDVVADTSIIAPLADVTLFVVRAGLLDRSALPYVETLYKEKRLNGMAVMLNNAEVASSKYGGYRYGSHYGYGYTSVAPQTV